MAIPANNMADQIIQLNAARNLVLGDANFYPQIVEGILPIIGANARLELRRWGADFLAETFASPTLAPTEKEKLSLKVLPTMKDLLEIPGEDAAVVKSVVQAAASMYPIVFRHIIDNAEETWVWEKMAAIKSNILRRWDSAPIGVRVCCIRFAQRVVQVQTPGVIADPRRPEKNETSLALVPRHHPLIPPPHLEAEASGLLDRVLSVFHENSGDAILINATLNGLSLLIRARATIANKIISAILNFNPLKHANSPMTPRSRVMVKSMERTTRALLINTNKRNPNGPLAGKIHQYVERMMQSRSEIFDEVNRKRPAPAEPTDGADHAKRARHHAPVRPIPPLPPGPTSFAQLFTLTDDAALSNFDVKILPLDLVIRIVGPVLAKIDQAALDEGINAIRSRHLTISREQHLAPTLGAPAGVDDEDDDYEPDYQPPTEDAEQILNKVEADGVDQILVQPEIALGPFKLPQPSPLTLEESAEAGKVIVGRVLSMVNTQETGKRQQKRGLNRTAGSNYDKETWTTILTRLATRSSIEAEDENSDPSTQIKQENGMPLPPDSANKFSVNNTVRESLFSYILEDFRRRIDIAITWLNEEWFNERIWGKAKLTRTTETPIYEFYLTRLMSSLMPYLDARADSKLLIRFLSEIPALPTPILSLVASLAKDPERLDLSVKSLTYLVMMRLPVREAALDQLEEIYREEEGAKKAVAKILGRYRPGALEQVAINGVKKDEVGQGDGEKVQWEEVKGSVIAREEVGAAG